MLLILQLSPGRRRALAAARAETLAVLQPLQAVLPERGPLGEVGGLLWVEVPASLTEIEPRLPLLAYSNAAYALECLSSPPSSRDPGRARGHDLPKAVRWRGDWYAVRPIWQRDEAEEREAAPDRRSFLLPTREGEVRTVRGYRGDRRGLPPADARLTVNLSLTPGCRRLLDPFAGAGGIVHAARAHGLDVFTTDIDPFVRYGLAGSGAAHTVADAQRLPFRNQSFDAIAGEPPYAQELTEVVAASLAEIARVLRPGGRSCLFCGEAQAESVAAASPASLSLLHRFPIDRKGTACEALLWERD
jgi:SAM-dependent methyltransferase